MKRITLNILIVASILILVTAIGILVTLVLKQRFSQDIQILNGHQYQIFEYFTNTNKNLQNTKTSMDNNTIALLTAVIAILTGLFFNPMLIKILAKINTVDTTNKTQHEAIHNELKIYKTENKTIANLNEIINHHLEIAPKDISSLIAHEGERLVYFASLVINSKFDYSILRSSKVQLDVARDEALAEIKGLPPEFIRKFIDLQCKSTSNLLGALHDLVSDEIRNSKQNRFRMVCEQYLDLHLNGIMDIYRELNNN